MNKKLAEDVQQGEYITDLPDEVYDYLSTAKLDGEDFYIVWDMDSLERALGVEDRSIAEEMLTDVFGDNWGYEDEWRKCDICDAALYYYDGDYWLDYDDGFTVCSDCLSRNADDSAYDYVRYLTNNYDDCNQFLSDEQLKRMGWIKLEGEYSNDYYGHNDSPKDILNKYMDAYPQVNFIFSSELCGQWGCRWSLWADQDLFDKGDSDEER